MSKYSSTTRPSSSLDQTSRNDSEHDQNQTVEVPITAVPRYSSPRSKYDRQQQASFMDSRSRVTPAAWSPQRSVILGSFSDPPTYVIHFLDTHLTLLQNYQICSLFGRVRIHGYNLNPLNYYSVYNYRTNTALPIEFCPQTTTTLVDVKTVIPDEQLAEDVVARVQQNGGDILLIRKESNEQSLFLKTMREHRFYSKWFMENYQIYPQDQWRQMELGLQVRLIETTSSNAVIPREEFLSTIDRIISRWLLGATEEFAFVVILCGEKDVGKSTFTRLLINRALNHINSVYNLIYFDCDIGQCEFTMGGCLSYQTVTSPLLGPPCSHVQASPKPDRILYYGQVSPQSSPVRYLEYVSKLRQVWNVDYGSRQPNRSMIVVNTMGWGTGLGLEILKETLCMCNPHVVVQLTDAMSASQAREQMPDVTLEWLLKQPVFVPYRRQIQMSANRQEDYDGKLNYEYIKLQSGASPNNQARPSSSNTQKPRPRDHRLLATWSYFFSSKLHRIHLPWSEVIHVSLLENTNPNALPAKLEKTIVGFCFDENMKLQSQDTIVCVGGKQYVLNPQKLIIECFGFGWIERCDTETQTYEIYTPVNYLSNISFLVTGAFDTPEEFQFVFKRVNVE